MTRWLSRSRLLLLAAQLAVLTAASNVFLLPQSASAITVAPGGTGATGVLNVTDFLPLADDVLEIEFQEVVTQGVDYDYLDVANFAVLDGRLDLKQINGFVPTIGESFDFLEGLQVQNEFTSVTWPNAVPGVALQLNYPANPVNGVVGVDFVAPQAVSSASITGSWDDIGIWVPNTVPTLASDVDLRNTVSSTNVVVDVDTNHAFAQAVEISAVKTATMTLDIQQTFNLSATHGITVGAEGTLAGRGTAYGPVSNVQGTVSPGAPMSTVPGTLTIGGTYDQEPSGALAIDLRGPTSDLLSATDDVNLAGDLNVTLVGPPPVVGQQYTIVETDGILAGAFDGFSAPGLGAYYVKYEPQAVLLVTTNLFNMDLSLDNAVNEADIDEFLLALINPDAYLDLLNASPGTIGDSPNDGDGVVDYDDIADFEAALAASGVFVSIRDLLPTPVPEPSTGHLLLVGIAIVSLLGWCGRRTLIVARLP